jgi:thiamine transport system permease protein
VKLAKSLPQLFLSRKWGKVIWLLPFLFLAVFYILPLVVVFSQVVNGEGTRGAGLGWDFIWQRLSFTLGQAALSTLLTLLVGLPAAYVFGRFRFKGKRLLRALTTLPFILPTVVVAAAFNALLGPRGWLNLIFMDWFNLTEPPIQILNTLGAILLAHVFYNTTIIIRLLGSAWAQLDTRLEQAGRVLGAGAWRNFWEVTLPLLRQPFLAATLLVFLFDFTSFGVVLLLGGPQYATLEVEIYTQAMVSLNLSGSALLSAVQLFFTLVITLVYTRIGGDKTVTLAPRLQGEGMRRARSWQEKVLVWGVVIILVLLLVSPLLALAGRSVTQFEADRGERGGYSTGFTLRYYEELFINRRGGLFYVPPFKAALNSIFYGGVTVVIAVTLGLLAAYALRRRTLFSRGADVLLMLPLGTSAVTLGFGMLLTFNQPPFDARSFVLLVPIAHSLVSLPLVVRTIQPALTAMPVTLRQAAAVMGASPRRAWFEVDLPILGKAVVVSAVFAFTISLGEFGATSFLARPEAPTLPVAISRFLSQPGALNYGQAMAMATLLMLVCVVCILFVDWKT